MLFFLFSWIFFNCLVCKCHEGFIILHITNITIHIRTNVELVEMISISIPKSKVSSSSPENGEIFIGRPLSPLKDFSYVGSDYTG